MLLKGGGGCNPLNPSPGSASGLSTHQVARYFSRLSSFNKSGVLKRNVNASQEEEEDLDYISEVEAMETRFQIRRELEL